MSFPESLPAECRHAETGIENHQDSEALIYCCDSFIPRRKITGTGQSGCPKPDNHPQQRQRS